LSETKTDMQKQNSVPEPQIPIIDLRAVKLFKECHILHSANFPLNELAERLHELPTRTHPISLFGSQVELQAAEEFLTSKGYIVASAQIASDEKFLQLKEYKGLCSGEHYQRLWKPAKIVSQFVDEFSSKCKNKSVLDIACGSGRDSVYMAAQGWQVSAVDYLPSAIEKASDLALRCKQPINYILLDLEKPELKDEWMILRQANKYGCVIVVRYLHRANFSIIKSMIDVGGFIVYQTFMRGCEKFGRPKNPKFLLEKGELAEIFSDFNIFVDEVEYLADGRPTNRFIAQKTT